MGFNDLSIRYSCAMQGCKLIICNSQRFPIGLPRKSYKCPFFFIEVRRIKCFYSGNFESTLPGCGLTDRFSRPLSFKKYDKRNNAATSAFMNTIANFI
jgi:hypothetical protein